jgi:hypothetical protein
MNLQLWGKFTSSLFVTLLSVMLVACGGGGGGGDSAGTAPTLQPMVDSYNTPMPSSFDNGATNASGANGVAAFGAPIPYAPVTIIDNASHTVSTTTDANGLYHARIDGFIPPLIAAVTKADATKWYSISMDPPVVRGFVNFNLTGLTDKIASDVAISLGKSSSWDLTPALVAGKPAALAQARSKLVTDLSVQISAVGLDPAKFDPVSALLVTNHKGYDKLLDNLVITNSSRSPTSMVIPHSLGGTIFDLVYGSGLTLSNGTDTLVIGGSQLSFTFNNLLVPGTSYNVQVASQPSLRNCSVLNGSGIVGASDITDVKVDCVSKVTGQHTGSGTGSGSTGGGTAAPGSSTEASQCLSGGYSSSGMAYLVNNCSSTVEACWHATGAVQYSSDLSGGCQAMSPGFKYTNIFLGTVSGMTYAACFGAYPKISGSSHTCV